MFSPSDINAICALAGCVMGSIGMHLYLNRRSSQVQPTVTTSTGSRASRTLL